VPSILPEEIERKSFCKSRAPMLTLEHGRWVARNSFLRKNQVLFLASHVRSDAPISRIVQLGQLVLDQVLRVQINKRMFTER